MLEIGMRDLKANLTAVLREVECTGKKVQSTTEAKLATLSQAGLIAWNRQKLQPLAPVAQDRGKRMVANLLLEDRE